MPKPERDDTSFCIGQVLKNFSQWHVKFQNSTYIYVRNPATNLMSRYHMHPYRSGTIFHDAGYSWIKPENPMRLNLVADVKSEFQGFSYTSHISIKNYLDTLQTIRSRSFESTLISSLYKGWFNYELYNVDISYYALQSPMVCDSFVLENGKYLLRQVDEIVHWINPIATDPLWNYIASMGAQGAFNTEFEDYHPVYAWMSQSYTDSTFQVENGIRRFRQANKTTNQVEKDEFGRIVKITRRTSNTNDYKTLEITY